MTDEKIRQYQKTLHDLDDRLGREKRKLLDQTHQPVGNAESNDISTSSLRPGTVGGNEGDAEVAIGLYDNVAQAHGEVAAALVRIAKKTFGLCEGCGKKIAEARLKVIPYARRCMACSGHEAVASKK